MVIDHDIVSSWPMSGVAVLDSNSCIDLKRRLRILQQWEFFLEMTRLVQMGSLVFPWEVRQELVNVLHPDVPGAWAGYAYRLIPTNLAKIDDRHTDAIRNVYFPNIGQAIDEIDNADPYVVGLALTLRSKGAQNVVVTEDRVVTTACEAHGLNIMSTDQFIERVRSVTNPEQAGLFD